MKTLQAGDKAVYLKGVGNGNYDLIIVTIQEITNRHVIYYDETGSAYQRNTTASSLWFLPVYIVRVLQDGRAREVNPLGEENEELASLHEHGFDNKDYAQWREAESQCLTLQMCYEFEYPIEGQLWYALLSSDKFTLIKPVTDEK